MFGEGGVTSHFCHILNTKENNSLWTLQKNKTGSQNALYWRLAGRIEPDFKREIRAIRTSCARSRSSKSSKALWKIFLPLPLDRKTLRSRWCGLVQPSGLGKRHRPPFSLSSIIIPDLLFVLPLLYLSDLLAGEIIKKSRGIGRTCEVREPVWEWKKPERKADPQEPRDESPFFSPALFSYTLGLRCVMQEAEAADLSSAGFPTLALEPRVIVFLVIVFLCVLKLCQLFFHLNY